MSKTKEPIHLLAVRSNAGLGHRRKECVWEEDVDGNWETDCRNLHILIDGNPIDNGMAFCCYCGGKLSVLVNGA